ncbi:MAG: hypothetical protein LBM60_00545 [Clostridium sp.]|jgi:membrane protein YdbS with pleckstrin-like domain|nr:hypothetical protein [Clostridium sp.]
MDPKKRSTKVRVFALIAVIVLVLSVLASLFVAIFDQSPSGWLFGAVLAASLTLPILLWIYTRIYTKIKEDHEATDDK